MIEITFNNPVKKSSSHNPSITFPFSILVTSPSAEYNQTYNNLITVSATETLLALWDYNNISDIEKVFFEFVLHEINGKSLDQLKNGPIVVSLTTDNQKGSKPFDPNKISNPNGYVIQIDESELKSNYKIGF
jgi:hypothetical protein